MELKLCLSNKEINQNNLIKQSLSMNNIITELSRPVRRRLKKSYNLIKMVTTEVGLKLFYSCISATVGNRFPNYWMPAEQA